MIKRDKIVAIGTRVRGVPRLCGSGSRAACARPRKLSTRWSRRYSSMTAVKTNVAAGQGMCADRAAIRERVMDDGCIYVRNGRVVVKGPAGPIAADKPDTVVAVTVVDAAIEPDARAPVTCDPHVSGRCVTPVTRRPIKADR